MLSEDFNNNIQEPDVTPKENARIHRPSKGLPVIAVAKAVNTGSARPRLETSLAKKSLGESESDAIRLVKSVPGFWFHKLSAGRNDVWNAFGMHD